MRGHALRLKRLLLHALLLVPSVASASQIIVSKNLGYDVRALSWDGSSLWTLDWDNRISRHDPETLERLWTIRPADQFIPAVMVSDGRRLISCSWPGLSVAEIDPSDGAILRKRRMNSADGQVDGDPAGLAWKDGELWLLMSGPTSLCRLDPSTGGITHKIRLPLVYARGLAWDGSTFWVTEGETRRLLRIDPVVGRVLDVIPAFGTGASGVTWDGHYLWVASGNLYKIDVAAEPYESMREMRSIPWDVYEHYIDVESENGFLWLSGTSIRRLDPNSPSTSATIPKPAGFGAGGIAFDGASLWSTMRLFGGQFFRIDPNNGQVLESFDYGDGEPLGVTFDGEKLWIADRVRGILRVLSWPGAIRERELIPPDPDPAGVAWDGQALWESGPSTGVLSRLDRQTGAVEAQFRLPLSSPLGISFDRQRGTLWALDSGLGLTVELAFPPGATHIFDWKSQTVDSTVALSWKLTTGSTASTIQVERASAPGATYSPLGAAVCSGGNCQFVDPNPIDGSISYYRLRVQEADASSKTIGPLSVAFNFSYSPVREFTSPGELRARCVPNPASAFGTSIWAVGAQGQRVHAKIATIQGRIVRSFDLVERSPGVFSGNWDGTAGGGAIVPSGVYFAVLESDSGVRTTVRVVLIR